MQKVTEEALLRAPRGYFTRREAAFWVSSCGAALDGLLKRAVNAGEIWRVVRGLFCLDRKFLSTPLQPMALAQLILGPSYVSLESALSWHGWIPEGVQAVTSVSMGRTREFATPLSVFSFSRVPQSSLFRGVERIEDGLAGGAIFMARPLKALADYVYLHRCDWTSRVPLQSSLRIESEMLAELSESEFDELSNQYRSKRVENFLGGLRKDLGL